MSASEPLTTRFLDVGDGHEIYIEEHGDPQGQPVVVLHGGPGAGCNRQMTRFFDESAFRIILFDQRGAGKSKPHGCLDDNDTWKLVGDIEQIRTEFGIDRWLVFGGSWGSTLALAYAAQHPTRCGGLILRGLFTLTQRELDWFYQGGTAILFPQAYQDLCSPIPENERDDIVGAYHRRLLGDDEDLARSLELRWTRYETSTAKLIPSDPLPSKGMGRFARAISRIEAHYFVNKGFFAHDGWLLDQAETFRSMPIIIIQGRYDVICPPTTAFQFVERVPHADLRVVEAAGHSTSEPGISAALQSATADWLKQRMDQ